MHGAKIGLDLLSIVLKGVAGHLGLTFTNPYRCFTIYYRGNKRLVLSDASGLWNNNAVGQKAFEARA